MAKRYGRNQKRAARQREAELARALRMAEFSLQMQTHRAQTAKSLKGNEEYLRYLWINNLEKDSAEKVIYIPTEANLPILESGKR